MEGEPQGITWESSVGNDMGNSLGRAPGRAPLGGKGTEAAAGWTEGKPWETAWGELRWERAESLGRSDTEAISGWTEGQTMGNSLGRGPLGRSDTEATSGWTEGQTVGNSLGRGPLGRSETDAWTSWTDRKQPWEIAWGVLSSINAIVSKNCAPKTFQMVCKCWAMGHA